MRNSALYCQKHYEMVLDENSGSSPPPNLIPNSPHHHSHGTSQHSSPLSDHHLHHPTTTFFNGAGSGQKGRPRKRKDPTTPSLGPVMEIGATTPPGMQHLNQNLGMTNNFIIFKLPILHVLQLLTFQCQYLLHSSKELNII